MWVLSFFRWAKRPHKCSFKKYSRTHTEKTIEHHFECKCGDKIVRIEIKTSEDPLN